MKVMFKRPLAKPTPKLMFDDLNVGEEFVINTRQSKGTVYTKVKLSSRLYSDFEYGQMENSTSKVFAPTTSPVKLV